MGGYGSGRRATKFTVEDCFSLDVAQLQAHIACLQQGTYTGSGLSGTNRIDFMVDRAEPDGFVVALMVKGHHLAPPLTTRSALEWTSPRFGGVRWWFTCPTCHRRCRKVYYAPQLWRFGCQHCLRLGYGCQRGGKITRLVWKIERLKYQLGARGQETAAAAPTPPRPKGMQWKRYEELVRQLGTAEDRYWRALGSWVEGLERKNAEALKNLRQLQNPSIAAAEKEARCRRLASTPLPVRSW
jgi:hypothetical protein